MVVLDFLFTIDPNLPLWINVGDDCTYYNSIREVIDSYRFRSVKYITLDGDGVLTLELYK